ncbi:hypothetical protein CEXT_315121 [Caerostris extrusa]|uniref:Uncharacterized protein n=1 Tax=Caerostris extrusa TaxID=172846 RepID=A0AAV4NA83_CAEEX|nr:hypothetical protein CEXT_315121 [Caerostris extrusa]
MCEGMIEFGKLKILGSIEITRDYHRNQNKTTRRTENASLSGTFHLNTRENADRYSTLNGAKLLKVPSGGAQFVGNCIEE